MPKKKAESTPVEKTPEVNSTHSDVDEREPDRVAMLSIRADGTPDQHKPIVIGDED